MSELSAEEKNRIYEEERARIAGERALSGASSSKKLLAAVLFTVVAGFGGGLAAYHQYQVQGLKNKLGEAIGRDLGLTETILRIESDSSKITFGEVFELCNKSVETRTSLIVELRGLYPEMDFRLKSQLIEYLSHENEFVRAKRDFYRKALEVSTASQLFVQQAKDYPTSVYAMSFYNNRVRQLKASLVEKAVDAEKSADEFSNAYENMAKEERVISEEARRTGLRFEPIFRKYAQENRQKADEAKQAAQLVAKL